MKPTSKTDRGRQWVNTLSWPDIVIARFFPRFFQKYAPDELRKQYAERLEKKHKPDRE